MASVALQSSIIIAAACLFYCRLKCLQEISEKYTFFKFSGPFSLIITSTDLFHTVFSIPAASILVALSVFAYC